MTIATTIDGSKTNSQQSLQPNQCPPKSVVQLASSASGVSLVPRSNQGPRPLTYR